MPPGRTLEVRGLFSNSSDIDYLTCNTSSLGSYKSVIVKPPISYNRSILFHIVRKVTQAIVQRLLIVARQFNLTVSRQDLSPDGIPKTGLFGDGMAFGNDTAKNG